MSNTNPNRNPKPKPKPKPNPKPKSHQDMKSVFAERQKFGRFYYRFPNGEAGTDVFDRTASFITYLFRTMSGTGYFAEAEPASREVTLTLT